MYIVAYRLLNLLNDCEFDCTDAHIARSLLDMLNEIEFMPIDQVAIKCHISKSTLSKFIIKRLGFEDYKEFRYNARKEKKRGIYTGNEEKRSANQFIETQGMEQYLNVLSYDVKNFLSGINMEQIQKLAEALYEYEKVAAFGAVYSETVAMDFMYMIAQEKKYIKTNIFDTKQEQFINQADDNTLIIFFSNSGQYLYRDGLKALNSSKLFIKKTRARIALITSNNKAAYDPCITYPILYHMSTNVQNHLIMERLVVNMIVDGYRKVKKRMIYKPGERQ